MSTARGCLMWRASRPSDGRAMRAWGIPHLNLSPGLATSKSVDVKRIPSAALVALLVLTCTIQQSQAATQAQVIATIPVGATPFGIAVTPDGSRLYVSNSTGGSVSVVDTATQSVTSTITSNVGTTPVGITVDASGTYAYVANYGAGTVTRITVVTGATSSIDVNAAVSSTCSNLLNIALTPNGTTLYVACQDQGRVSSAPVGGGPGTIWMSVGSTFPTDVALSSDGSTLVSSLSGTNQAYILDGSGSSFVSVSAGPYAVALSPTTGLAYLAGQTSGDISVVNPSTRSTVGSTITLGGSLSDIAITPDGSTALVSVVDQDLVQMVDLGTRAVTGTIPVGDGPQSLTISRDGRYAYTANRNANTVSVIRLPERPASGEEVPRAALQQFARSEADSCEVQPDDLVDFPALVGHRNIAWAASWAQWPNAGTGGFVCTRQPYYTSTGTWSVE